MNTSTKYKSYVNIAGYILVGIVAYFIINNDKVTIFDVKSQSFEGIVIKKEIDSRNTPLVYIDGKKGDKFQYFNVGSLSGYNKIDTGDYIIKKRGTIDYIVIRKSDTIAFNMYQ